MKRRSGSGLPEAHPVPPMNPPACDHCAGAPGNLGGDGVLPPAVFPACPQRQPGLCSHSAGSAAADRTIGSADLSAHGKSAYCIQWNSAHRLPNAAADLESQHHGTLRHSLRRSLRPGRRNVPGYLKRAGCSAAAIMESVPDPAGQSGDGLAQNAPFHSLCALSAKTFCFLRVLVIHWKQEEPLFPRKARNELWIPL